MAGFTISEEMCFVTLLAPGLAPGGEDHSVVWAKLAHDLSQEKPIHDVFVPFGSGVACVITRTANPSDLSALREKRLAWGNQVLGGFRAKAFHEWVLGRRLSDSPPPRPLRAVVGTTLRTDLLLEEGHLTPSAIAEIVVTRLQGLDLECDPWLSTGETDLFFVLSANDPHVLGHAVNYIRGITLGDIFPSELSPTDAASREASGIFSATLRSSFELAATPWMAQILRAEGEAVAELNGLHGDGDPQVFVQSLRVFSATRTIVGPRLGIVNTALDRCTEVSRSLRAEAAARLNPQDDPVAWAERFVHAALATPAGALRECLTSALGSSRGTITTFVSVRVRPGRESVIRRFLPRLRTAVLRALGVPAVSSEDCTSVFGSQDVILLDGTQPVDLVALVAMLVVLHHLATRDPCTSPRLNHVVRGTQTVVGFQPEALSENRPHELKSFVASELRAWQPFAPDTPVQQRLCQVSAPRWDTLPTRWTGGGRRSTTRTCV